MRDKAWHHHLGGGAACGFWFSSPFEAVVVAFAWMACFLPGVFCPTRGKQVSVCVAVSEPSTGGEALNMLILESMVSEITALILGFWVVRHGWGFQCICEWPKLKFDEKTMKQKIGIQKILM